MPLNLTIITQPNLPPSPPSHSSPQPYEWTILLHPDPLRHTHTSGLIKCASTQIFSSATGYTRTKEKMDYLEAHDLQNIAKNWPAYETVCIVPEGNRGEYLFVELDNALAQNRRRWVEVFLEGLVNRGWLSERHAGRVCRVVGFSPVELEKMVV
ncbi:uncharacterized protein BDV17DRAFT_286605 [Aspergillus undulatus]|uniref:uncharacterized protein n=1 Tax=Aspergillus undulatus TaxID=1810928 RepID=UPI003CCE07A4